MLTVTVNLELYYFKRVGIGGDRFIENKIKKNTYFFFNETCVLF